MTGAVKDWKGAEYGDTLFHFLFKNMSSGLPSWFKATNKGFFTTEINGLSSVSVFSRLLKRDVRRRIFNFQFNDYIRAAWQIRGLALTCLS